MIITILLIIVTSTRWKRLITLRLLACEKLIFLPAFQLNDVIALAEFQIQKPQIKVDVPEGHILESTMTGCESNSQRVHHCGTVWWMSGTNPDPSQSKLQSAERDQRLKQEAFICSASTRAEQIWSTWTHKDLAGSSMATRQRVAERRPFLTRIQSIFC